MKLTSPVFAVSGVNYPFISHHHLVKLLKVWKSAFLKILRQVSLPAEHECASTHSTDSKARTAHRGHLASEIKQAPKGNARPENTSHLRWSSNEWGPQLGRTLHVVNSVRWVDKSSQLHVAVRFKLSKKCAQVPQHPCAAERRIFAWTQSGYERSEHSRYSIHRVLQNVRACECGLKTHGKNNYWVKRVCPSILGDHLSVWRLSRPVPPTASHPMLDYCSVVAGFLTAIEPWRKVTCSFELCKNLSVYVLHGVR